MFFRRKEGRTKRRRIRKLRLLAILFVLSLLSTAAFFFGMITAIAGEIPNLDPARVQAQEVNGYIYAGDGKTILAVLRGSEARVLVTWPQISPWMKHAIVDVEDKRFYEHRGVDVHGIARAIWADIRHKGAVQGGSTITQQFVKYGAACRFSVDGSPTLSGFGSGALFARLKSAGVMCSWSSIARNTIVRRARAAFGFVTGS